MKYQEHLILVTIVLVLAPLIIFNAPFSSSYSHGPNYENVTIDTTVNITDALPEIVTVIVNDNTNVTLSAGSTVTVYCNVTIRDYNGADDITKVNATFYHEFNTSNTSDDNNWHYTNDNCSLNKSSYGVGGYYADYMCNFSIYYYAINGTWTCNATVIDDNNFTDDASNTTYIENLYALNVTSPIDYGDMAVEDTSVNKTANITNFGNSEINISIYGYGVTPGDGLAMNCSVGNITVANEKWSLNATADYAAKTSLVGTPGAPQLIGYTIQIQYDDSTPITNTTYWQLYIPPNPFGVCNGSIVFSAEIP